ncbi:AAA ATPase-like protein [Bisgaardia hudsonensis]|uniref:AAA ATPase-like protein n=1 Tax=Bisgaardia hudsonensis TaxID=109472 RepID=A0A4R2MWL5_9PAST|nr:AAA family ATPase [Bisgaardia hudsonensis]QLB13597.1 hypothetical protein A6A11_08255 [Bisgaardia hudsonensis]TCP11927.1 AAA ATPase-like protein [Bisgaardia hudsonensis]
MKLNISNFSIIKQATIEINGLTVIAGENDTGKSTIGKLLFAIIKASQKYEEDFKEDILPTKIMPKIVSIASVLQPYEKNLGGKIIIRMLGLLNLDSKNSDEIRNEIKKFTIFIEELDITKKSKEEILNNIESIKLIVNENNSNDKLKQKQKALKMALYSEFKKITNFDSFIKLEDRNQSIVEFSCDSNDLKNVFFKDDMDFDDITYIESPFVIQFRNMFLKAGTLLDPIIKPAKETIPLHLKDLANKLKSPNNDIIKLIDNEELIDISGKIATLIDGNFYYDKKQNDFILKRNGLEIPSMNIASGIKSLGLLNTLLSSGIINSNRLLILDEPETNLHPKWQNKYAEILCKLVENDIKIIVASHSPYMISALEHYSKHISNKSFYWASRDEVGNSIFEDKTETVMEDIIQRFANSFDEIY